MMRKKTIFPLAKSSKPKSMHFFGALLVIPSMSLVALQPVGLPKHHVSP